MEIDVWDDGSVKTVQIAERKLLREYEYVCTSSECEALAFNGNDGECPVCHNRNSVVSVDEYLHK